MEAKGNGDLKRSYLQSPDSVSIAIPEPVNDLDKRTRSIMFKIGNIKCASCAVSIESVLRQLNGVKIVTISPLTGQAAIQYVPKLVTAKKMKEAIEDAGFSVNEFPPEQHIEICHLRVKGMSCSSCSLSIEHALQMVNGVEKAVVSLALEEAKVHFDPNFVDTSDIIEAVTVAGFGAELISSGNDDGNKVHLQLEGVSSLDDMDAIQSSLEAVNGVNHVEIDLVENRITITYDADLTGPRSLIDRVQEAGNGGSKCYKATLYVPPRRRDTAQDHEIRLYRDQFLLSCLFSVPVFVFSMVLPMIHPAGDWLEYRIHNMLTVGTLLRGTLCTPVQFIIGKRFYVGSYHALRRRSANMDVLVAMGTNAAYFY